MFLSEVHLREGGEEGEGGGRGRGEGGDHHGFKGAEEEEMAVRPVFFSTSSLWFQSMEDRWYGKEHPAYD